MVILIKLIVMKDIKIEKIYKIRELKIIKMENINLLEYLINYQMMLLFFVKDYFYYYKTKWGYHPRSHNSNDEDEDYLYDNWFLTIIQEDKFDQTNTIKNIFSNGTEKIIVMKDVIN